MNIPIFLHESNDSSQLAVPVFGPEAPTRRQGDRPATRAAATEDSSARSAQNHLAADPPHQPSAKHVPTAATVAEQGIIYRFDQADYTALARRYTTLLRGALLENAMPTDATAFCRRMLDDLEGALAQSGSGRLRGRKPDDRFDADLELQWLCNQCQYCLGDAAAPSLGWNNSKRDVRNNPKEDARSVGASITDGEMAMISLLFTVSGAVSGRSTDCAACRRHGGRALAIFRQRLREAIGRIVSWVRQQGSAAKALLRREQSRHANP